MQFVQKCAFTNFEYNAHHFGVWMAVQSPEELKFVAEGLRGRDTQFPSFLIAPDNLFKKFLQHELENCFFVVNSSNLEKVDWKSHTNRLAFEVRAAEDFERNLDAFSWICLRADALNLPHEKFHAYPKKLLLLDTDADTSFKVFSNMQDALKCEGVCTEHALAWASAFTAQHRIQTFV